MKLSNWGLYPVVEDAKLRYYRAHPQPALPTQGPWIPRGMGRCYGDSALAPTALSSLRFNRMLDFDADTGELTCEAGVTFDDLLHTFVPRGWFPPVTPGTKYVSIGGAIASDVHGKNHHTDGSFGKFVERFTLLLANGETRVCSRAQNSDLFFATLGGMGLTGMILQATFRLRPIETSFIDQTCIKTRNLAHSLEVFDQHANTTYSMAWLDCLAQGESLGRCHVLVGEHATLDQLRGRKAKQPLVPHKQPFLRVPFHFPGFALNKYSIKAFNFLYYHRKLRQEQRSIVHYEPFFYPLDMIGHWNRIYGKRGFTQHQFVVPKAAGHEALTQILTKISDTGMGSFLTVLKSFGPKDEGWLSFPSEGYTLAQDFPITPALFPLLNELDAIIHDCGGRLYLTKDARMSPEMLAQGYPNLSKFKTLLHNLDPEQRIQSLQSQRLGLHDAEASRASSQASSQAPPQPKTTQHLREVYPSPPAPGKPTATTPPSTFSTSASATSSSKL